MDKLKCGHNKLRNLSKLDGYEEDNVVQKENIFHLSISIGMFLFVKTISKLNIEHSVLKTTLN